MGEVALSRNQADIVIAIKLIKKHIRLVLIITAMFMLSCGLLAYIQPPSFEGTALIKVGMLQFPQTRNMMDQQDYDSLIETPSDAIGIEQFQIFDYWLSRHRDLSTLDGRPIIRQLPGTRLIEVKLRATSPDAATKLVDDLVQHLIERHRQEGVKQEELIKAEITSLDTTYSESRGNMQSQKEPGKNPDNSFSHESPNNYFMLREYGKRRSALIERLQYIKSSPTAMVGEIHVVDKSFQRQLGLILLISAMLGFVGACMWIIRRHRAEQG
jgi:capsular polysaccharide biosynthesis protein